MPFFVNNVWFSSLAKLWLWVTLTIPFTMAAFAFYLYGKKCDTRENGLFELGE